MNVREIKKCEIKKCNFILCFFFPNRPDVYFVTATQALTWMTDPRPLKELSTYEDWGCKPKFNIPGPSCNNANKCALDFKPAESNFTMTR